MKALIDSHNKINAIYPAYTMRLDFHIRKIDISVQKINGFHLDTFSIIIVGCSIKDQLKMI